MGQAFFREEGEIAGNRHEEERHRHPNADSDPPDNWIPQHRRRTLPNPTTALQEWHRVVEPGGRILLIEGYWNHDEPWDEYEHMHDDLPMYDGRPPDELSDVLADQGFSDITHAPLMDATLWGRDPHFDYYIMSGTVPR